MSLVSPPQVPSYRITLFYGPELVETTPKTSQCVFNVKKRSWKGGVQIVVMIEEAQLARLGSMVNFDDWLEPILGQVSQIERADYLLRAHDIFVQQICYLKLQLVIQHGIRQENANVGSELFVQELDDAMAIEVDQLKSQVLKELDLEEVGNS